MGWLGAALSLLLLLGFGNALSLAALWVLYGSVVRVGQVWYGFGWEIQLLETGFLAIFLCPLLDPQPIPRSPPPLAVVWLYRWLIARIMLGAGLIKLRGDPCWRALSCLDFHYETQPIPNPLSLYFHQMPAALHRAGVLFNHLCELVLPLLVLFGPRRVRHVAGALLALFQLLLIASGNLSFLNWLTLVPVAACFDDGLLARALPRRLVARADRARATSTSRLAPRVVAGVLFALVALLSVDPVRNLFSREQRMNSSFERLALVNTYGAFGSVGRVRQELVFEGTRDAVITAQTRWVPYEFKCKPGDPARPPCLISPLHLRLDWLAWFAAMSDPEHHPWAVHLVWKLLHNDPGALSLLAGNPFPGAPPRYVRVRIYRYTFAPRGERVWWHRTLEGEWLPAVSADDPELREFLRAEGYAVR